GCLESHTPRSVPLAPYAGGQSCCSGPSVSDSVLAPQVLTSELLVATGVMGGADPVGGAGGHPHHFIGHVQHLPNLVAGHDDRTALPRQLAERSRNHLDITGIDS